MFRNKKFLVTALFFILLSSLTFASVINYKVSPQVPLGKNLTITGNLTGGGFDGMYCHFYIFNDQNGYVWELTSEPVSSDGTFASSYFKVDEPLLYRGQDYNAITNCDGNIGIAQFSVIQREGIAHTTQQEIDYAFDRNNLSTVFIAGSILLLAFFLMIAALWFYKTGKKVGGS